MQDLATTLDDLAARMPLAEGATPAGLDGALALVCNRAEGAVQPVAYRRSLCVIARGTKEIVTGARSFRLCAGQMLAVGAGLPTVSRVIEAPLLGLSIEIDAGLVAELAAEMAPPDTAPAPLADAVPVGPELTAAASRLAGLVGRDEALRVLGPGLVREIHYWALAGPGGAILRGLAGSETLNGRLGRALALIGDGTGPARPVEELAAAAGMSTSGFHSHFRAHTGLSPLRYQKELRLHAARRRLLAGAETAAAVAHAVGYESASQFSRDYARLFGAPPARAAAEERQRIAAGLSAP